MDLVPATKGKAKKSRQGPNSILVQPFMIPVNVQGGASSSNSSTNSSCSDTTCGVSYLQSLQELAMQTEENIRLLMLPTNPANTPVAADVVVPVPVVAPAPKKTLREKIEETAELLKEGIIDDEEYQTRRKLILSSLDD